MEQIGNQIKLPLRTAFQISVQGIRIRLGRALVTIAGVVLGIAFFMSVLTGELIKRAVAQEQKLRQTVGLMASVVQSEVGTAKGKVVAVAGLGSLSPAEQSLLRRLAGGEIELRRAGPEGLRPGFAKGADLLLVLGDATASPIPLQGLGEGMRQKVAIDSVAERSYPGGAGGLRRELFFGERASQETREQEARAAQERFRTLWILSISLLVTIIGITNALLMSVTERFKEIGTMKCLGALSSFIRQLFLIESTLIGFCGSAFGVLLGALIPLLLYGLTFGFALVFGSISYFHLAAAGLLSLFLGTTLSIVAALYPARFASRMVPAMALRSNV